MIYLEIYIYSTKRIRSKKWTRFLSPSVFNITTHKEFEDAMLVPMGLLVCCWLQFNTST